MIFADRILIIDWQMSHWIVKSRPTQQKLDSFDTKPVCQTTSHGPAESDSFLLTCFGKALIAKRIVNICDFSQLKKLNNMLLTYSRFGY